MDKNEQIFDQLVLHQIDLILLSKIISKKIIEILREFQSEIITLIPDLSIVTLKRKLKQIDLIASKKSNKTNETLYEFIEEFIQFEVNVFPAIISKVDPAIKLRVIKAQSLIKLIREKFFRGRTLQQHVASIIGNYSNNAKEIIQQSLFNGSNNVVKLLLGTPELKYTDGVLAKNIKRIEAFAKTLLLDYGSEIRNQYVNETDGLFEKELYVAILDSRTTDFCRSNNGKIFGINEGPKPPVHFNCRSLRIPLLSGHAPQTMNFETWFSNQNLPKNMNKNGIFSTKNFETTIERLKNKYQIN